MLDSWLFGAVLIAHWIADFVLQTDKMALNKSKSNRWLAYHVGAYTLFMSVFFGPLFGIINGLCHLATDWFSSRITTKLWASGDRHNFFVVIGLDQLAHTLVLLGTLSLIW